MTISTGGCTLPIITADRNSLKLRYTDTRILVRYQILRGKIRAISSYFTRQPY